MFLAAVVAGILPSIERYGVLGTDAIAAGIAWAGFLYVLFSFLLSVRFLTFCVIIVSFYLFRSLHANQTQNPKLSRNEFATLQRDLAGHPIWRPDARVAGYWVFDAGEQLE